MTEKTAMTDAAAAADAAPESTAQAAPRKQQPTPYDELLCTICGLKACWQAPADATPKSS